MDEGEVGIGDIGVWAHHGIETAALGSVHY